MEYKYVMIDHSIPVILCDATSHKDVTGNITSAGFFRYDKGKVICYGISQSTNSKPEDGDEEILSQFIKRMIKEEFI